MGHHILAPSSGATTPLSLVEDQGPKGGGSGTTGILAQLAEMAGSKAFVVLAQHPAPYHQAVVSPMEMKAAIPAQEPFAFAADFVSSFT